MAYITSAILVQTEVTQTYVLRHTFKMLFNTGFVYTSPLLFFTVAVHKLQLSLITIIHYYKRFVFPLMILDNFFSKFFLATWYCCQATTKGHVPNQRELPSCHFDCYYRKIRCCHGQSHIIYICQSINNNVLPMVLPGLSIDCPWLLTLDHLWTIHASTSCLALSV